MIVSASVVRSEMNLRTILLAGLSYLGVLCFASLLVARDDGFVQFHARQGLVIWMAGMVALLVLHVPVIGEWVFGTVSMVVLAYSVLGIASVLFRRAWKLPLVSWVAERL